MEDEKKLNRSPQFPFISLEKAILRAHQFEEAYGQHPGRASLAPKAWGYAEKSSGGTQTVAALIAFGLLKDEGSGDARKLRLTPLALTILKDKRPGAAEAAIKEAALTPRIIAEMWREWGTQRPPDEECVSTLHLDKKFTEEAADRFVRVYDQTIRYAKLEPADTSGDNGRVEEELEGEAPPEKPDTPLLPPPKPQGKVPLMENERVVFAHELRPNQSFRVLVSGEVDQDMVKALKAFAEFQANLVSQKKPETSGNEGQ